MVNEGAVDAIIPMIYWPVTETPGDRLDFRTLIEDHLAHRTSGKVFAGFGNTLTFDQAAACVRAAREAGADGVVLFDWSLFQADMDRFHDELFSD
jgi:dihydrodipicolinate synthase/N-acetylneuraminate lyase